MVRDDGVWEFAVFDKAFARGGASEMRYVLHYDEAGDADGFATYRFKEKFDEEPEGEVRVKEVWAEEPRRTPACGGTCSTSTSRAASAMERAAGRAAATPDRRRPRCRDDDHRQPLRPCGRRGRGPLGAEVRRRRRPGHRGRRLDPAGEHGCYRLVTDGDPEGRRPR